jgi:putative phage-type endonuclease
MRVINLEQNTPEWLQWRTEGLGASEAPTIVGRNPYQTPYELFRVKAGFDEAPDLSGNPNIKRGNSEEEGNRSRLEDKYGIVLLPLCVEHSELPWMRASLDGISSRDGTVFELKAPCESVYLEIARNKWKSKTVLMYAVQLQHQLRVTGQERGVLVFSFRGHDLEFPIRAKTDFQDKLVRCEESFWNAVEKKSGVDPDPERDFILNGDDRFLQAASQYRGVHAEVSALENDLEAAKQRLYKQKRQLLNLSGGMKKVRGGGVQISHFTNSGKVDYKKMYEALIRQNPNLMNALNEEDFRSGGYAGTKITLINH